MRASSSWGWTLAITVAGCTPNDDADGSGGSDEGSSSSDTGMQSSDESSTSSSSGTDDGSTTAPVDTGSTGQLEVWQVRTLVETSSLSPVASTGCLVPNGDVFATDTVLDVVAADERFVVLDEQGTAVRAEDVETIFEPDPLPEPELSGEVVVTTSRYVYDETACPVELEELTEHTEVGAVGRFFDPSYRGFVITDRELALAPVRAVEVEGWEYPWHATVKLIKPVDAGFVIGGGIVIGPQTILTVAHLGIDETWCYSRVPNAGEAWENGEFVCDNIVGPAVAHPDGVDAAMVSLVIDDPGPFALVQPDGATVGDDYFTHNLASQNTHVFSDSTIASIGNFNAFCDPWPANSSFVSQVQTIGPGDSGGPAFVGDLLVGLVHGERCNATNQHVFVYVPGIYDFVESALP